MSEQMLGPLLQTVPREPPRGPHQGSRYPHHTIGLFKACQLKRAALFHIDVKASLVHVKTTDSGHVTVLTDFGHSEVHLADMAAARRLLNKPLDSSRVGKAAFP